MRLCDECVTLPVKMCSRDRKFTYLVTSSEMIPRVSSFAFNSWNVLITSDTFLKNAVIIIRSPHSEFAVTLAASRPEDSFIDLNAISILGAKISIVVKMAFWIIHRFNNITHFTINAISEKSFQCLKFRRNLIGCWNTIVFINRKYSDNKTAFDHNILPSAVYSITNIIVLIEVVYMSKKLSVLPPFLPSWNDICFNKWIVLITITNKSNNRV